MYFADLGLVPRSASVLTFAIGDNGSSSAVTYPPFIAKHDKGTLYEGGVNVPFIVQGPGVQAGESQALVSSTDIFATVAELVGVPSAAEDSVHDFLGFLQ